MDHGVVLALRQELDRKAIELDQAAARCAQLERVQLQLERQQKLHPAAAAPLNGAAAGGGGSSGGGSIITAEKAERLRGRCAALVKERVAVQTIMELKVNVLVNEVAKAAHALMQNGNGDNGAVQTLGKELSALQRLVGASIQALRNAAQEDAAREEASR
jgi:hypothetical protein